MSAQRVSARILLPIMLLAWGAAAAIQRPLDRQLDALRAQPVNDYVLPGSVLRSLSVGQNGLLANIYWTRVVQYFGTQRLNQSADFTRLKPLLDTTVQLDPQLLIAYYFGAFFLSTEPPRGAGRPDHAVDLLQRGIQANPDQWRLYHHLGFTYYWELGDYEKAAAAYMEGSKNPKAQAWMKVMAAGITNKGGNREISRFLWSEILANSQDQAIRWNAERHLKLLQAADDIDALEALARQFHEREGRWPVDFRDLLAVGYLRAVPRDPDGVPYVLSYGGKVAINPESILSRDNTPSPTHQAATQSAAPAAPAPAQ